MVLRLRGDPDPEASEGNSAVSVSHEELGAVDTYDHNIDQD